MINLIIIYLNFIYLLIDCKSVDIFIIFNLDSYRNLSWSLRCFAKENNRQIFNAVKYTKEFRIVDPPFW